MQPSDTHHPNPRLAEKLAAIYRRRSGPTVDLTIRPAYYALLRELGNPHEHLPPVIHVAGTNGKGSTIAMMRACLEAAGYRVHAYTSPHLVRFNERIVLAGEEITDEALEMLLDEAMGKPSAAEQTFFELTTAVAFSAFARTPADIILLETGLGGRLDSTNVITRPVVTVITPIGDDHKEFLGDTLVEIAGEKAGIMKAGVPCVIAAQDDATIDAVFAARAVELGCLLHCEGSEWSVTTKPSPSGRGFMFRHGENETIFPLPALPGAHQIQNAGAALAALDLCGLGIPDAAKAQGMRTVRWPARLQRLKDPAPGWELWLDGAHNGHGAKALAAQIAAWRIADGMPVHIILGMLARKDASAILSPLAAVADSVTFVPVPGEASHTLSTAPQALNLRQGNDVNAAIAQLKTTAPRGRLIVAGSLYLAGAMLASR